jgi:L-rhamnose mutarotase
MLNIKKMKRVAFKMKLKEGCFAEYKKRHDEIWPELSIFLSSAGIVNYSIFFDLETNILFAYHELLGSGGAQDQGATPIVQKWWKYMADIMETNSDNSPVSSPLEEAFYLK